MQATSVSSTRTHHRLRSKANEACSKLVARERVSTRAALPWKEALVSIRRRGGGRNTNTQSIAPHPQSVNHASASGERLHLGSSGLARRRSTRTQSRPMDSHTLEYDTGVSVRSEREGGGLCFLKGNGKGKGSVVEATRVRDAAKIYHWHRDAHWLAAKQSGGLSAQKPANASWVCARVASLAKHFQLSRTRTFVISFDTVRWRPLL